MSDCIVWRGYTNRGGYGVKTWSRKHRLLHRVAWEWVNGPIPEGFLVLHRCDNPPCVNPDHLFLGTHLENTRDMITKGRSRGQKQTHCKHGHPLFGKNLYIKPVDGARQCRTCYRISGAKYRSNQAAVEALSGDKT